MGLNWDELRAANQARVAAEQAAGLEPVELKPKPPVPRAPSRLKGRTVKREPVIPIAPILELARAEPELSGAEIGLRLGITKRTVNRRLAEAGLARPANVGNGRPRRTHCSRGHEMEPEVIGYCRECKRIRDRETWRRKRSRQGVDKVS